MLKYKPLALLVALIIAAGLLFSRPSDKELILANLEELINLAEIDEPSDKLENLSISRLISRFFCENFHLDPGDQYSINRDFNQSRLSQEIFKLKSTLDRLELEVSDVEVEVDEDFAVVEMNASALGSIPKEEGQFLEIHRVEIELEKIEKQWLICEATVIENLRQ